MPSKSKRVQKKDKLFTFIEWLAVRPLLTELTLTAITVLFGMQVLRVVIPDFNWILGDRIGLSFLQLGLVAIAIFLIGFLSGPLSWLTGNRRLITFTIVVLGLVRLLMQVLWDTPLFNFALVIVGTIVFIIFLPAAFEDARLRGGKSVSNFVLGLLCGLALDTAINGAFGTYDVVWQAAFFPVLLTLLLFVFQLILVIGTTPEIYHSASSSAEAKKISLARSFTWLAVGPFLFLELVVFQNIPRLATLTGWSLPLAFGLTLIAQLAGIAVATLVITRNWRMLWAWALGAGAILVVTLVFASQQPASLIAALFVVGQVLLSSIITMVLLGIASSAGKTSRSTLWIANGIGMILFIVLVFAYYAVYEIRLPYHNWVVELAAGVLVALCAIGAVIRSQKMQTNVKLWAVPAFAIILLVLPLAQIITWRAPAPTPGPGLPVTVMTYNLNQGFNTNGKLNIDEMAKVIEDNRPDILALQEVSRGWLTNGRLDMLEYLSHRLQMPYVYEPTTDPFWGNAILSRYPIIAFSRESLPPADSIIQRGFIAALIGLGTKNQLKVMNTQFDDIPADSDARQAEAQTIIDFWGGLGDTVILGDLSTTPQSPEITKFIRASLYDTAIIRGQPPTFPSNNPSQRLDYIWASPDLKAADFRVQPSTASDHLPVIAVLER